MNAAGSTRRFYIDGETVPFEEDETHEFKGHSNLAEEEIPSSAVLNNSDKRSRKPISYTLNAFLNTGRGGTVYMGIPDNGRVMGLQLSQYKKDHLYVALEDLMTRFNPPVEAHRYTIKFIPIVPKNSSQDVIDKIVSHDSSQYCEAHLRFEPHILRTSKFCWCDREKMAKLNIGILESLYVVEIVIPEWDPEDIRNKYAVGEMKMQPVHETEGRLVYFRRQASVTQCSKDEVLKMSKQKVDDFYGKKLTNIL